MNPIRFRLRFHPGSRWGSSWRSPRPSSWIFGVLFLRGEREKEGKRNREKRDRGDGKKGKKKGGDRGKEAEDQNPHFWLRHRPGPILGPGLEN